VVDDLVGIWERFPHEQHGSKSFLRNGLSNNHDGSQDHLVSRTAKAYWDERRCPELRARAESDAAFLWKTWCEKYHGADNIPLSVVNELIGGNDSEDEEPEGAELGLLKNCDADSSSSEEPGGPAGLKNEAFNFEAQGGL
jgi:hypothetical protein